MRALTRVKKFCNECDLAQIIVSACTEAYVELRLDTPDFALHEGFGEVELRVPQLREERQSQLSCCEALEDFLEPGSARQASHGRYLLTSIVMKFFNDLLIFRPSICK